MLEEFVWEATLEKPIRFQQLSREQLVKYDSCDTSCCLASCVAQSFDLMLRVWKMAGSQLGGEFSEDCPSPVGSLDFCLSRFLKFPFWVFFVSTSFVLWETSTWMNERVTEKERETWANSRRDTL